MGVEGGDAIDIEFSDSKKQSDGSKQGSKLLKKGSKGSKDGDANGSKRQQGSKRMNIHVHSKEGDEGGSKRGSKRGMGSKREVGSPMAADGMGSPGGAIAMLGRGSQCGSQDGSKRGSKRTSQQGGSKQGGSKQGGSKQGSKQGMGSPVAQGQGSKQGSKDGSIQFVELEEAADAGGEPAPEGEDMD